MPTTPFAQIQMSINGGALVSGGQTAPSAATVQLSAPSNAFWQQGQWEIYAFPAGWPTPAGWTLDVTRGVIFFAGVGSPPLITLEAAATRWGKWLARLIVNAGVKNGALPTYDVAGNLMPNDVVDIASGWEVVSPIKGLHDVALSEGGQFFSLTKWVGALQASLRLLDAGGGGGSVPTGTGVPHITAGGQDAAAIHGTAAGQILAVNAGVTDVAFVGVSQDATLSASGALAVVQLTGSAGLVSAVANTALALPGSSGAVASSGDLRVGKTFALMARNSTNTATANILSLDGSNNLNIGDSSGFSTLNVVSINGFQNTGLSTTYGNLAFTLYWSGATLKCPSFVLNDSAANITALTFVPVSNGATTQTVAAGVTSFTLGWAPSATAGSPTNVNGQAAGGAGASSGGAVSVLGGAGVNGGTGGAVSISGGAGGAPGGLAGAVRLQIKTAGTTVLECAEVVSGNRVLSLCFMSNVTSTQMPANTGDGVVFLANRAIVPSANSVGGGIIYCEAGALKYRGTAGTVTQLGAA